jgi:serine/threonine protein phosphatase PrpC
MISYCVKTWKGYIPIGPETGFKQKENQDSSAVIETFMNVNDLYFFGVYDGHGMNGKKASQYIKTWVPFNLEKFAQMNLGENFDENTVSEFFISNPNKSSCFVKAHT